MRCISFYLLVLLSSCGFSQEELQEELQNAFENSDLERIRTTSLKLLEFEDTEVTGYAGLGYYSLEIGEYEKAIKYYQKANEFMPAFEAYLQIAKAYELMGEYDHELDNINKAIHCETYYTAELKRKLFDIGILKTVDTTVVIQSNSNISLKRKVEWFADRKQYDSALFCMEKVVEWDSNALNLYMRGDILMQSGNYERALVDFNTALDMHVEFDRFQILLKKAFALGKIGELDEAFNLFKRIESQSQIVYPDIYLYQGLIYIENGKTMKGCELLNMAEKLGVDLSKVPSAKLCE